MREPQVIRGMKPRLGFLPLKRRIPGAAVALAAALGLAALSRAPYAAHPEAHGIIRLSWSAKPERIEVCREVPEEELQGIPAHMRQPVVCEGRSAAYRLTVTVDGQLRGDELVTGGGARSDRPIHLFRQFRSPPGRHVVEVRFERAEGQDGRDGRDGQDGTGESRAPHTPTAQPPNRSSAQAPSRPTARLDALPPRLELEAALDLPPRRVVLVTYDADRKQLVLRSALETR